MSESLAAVERVADSPPGVASAGASSHDLTFRGVLSTLNPLQYLPVVGIIYRAVTGDAVAEPVRDGVAVVAGALMGGPIGVLVAAAGIAAQKALETDALAHEAMVAIGVIHDQPATVAQAETSTGTLDDPITGWTSATLPGFAQAAATDAARTNAAVQTAARQAYASLQQPGRG